MTRSGVWLNAVAGLALLAVLGVAEHQRRTAPWRTQQAEYLRRVRAGASDDLRRAWADETVRPHRVSLDRFDAIDRCTTCHLGHEPGAPTFDAAPFRGHPAEVAALEESHPLDRFGCTPCHGGQGRSLEHDAAHDPRAETGGWSAFTPPRDRCARCHPQGGERSPRGERGAAVYFAQGCPGCHRPGRRGPGVGPDLSSIGLRGERYLRQVLLYPDEVYPETIMPPLRFVLDEDGEDLAALIAHLRGYEPWPRSSPRRDRWFDPRECTTCHRVVEEGRRPTGRPHRCSHLRREATWLRCARCHDPEGADPAAAPPAGGSLAGDAALEDDELEPAGAVDAGGPSSDGGDAGGEGDAGSPAEGAERPRPTRPPRPAAVAAIAADPDGACPVLTEALTTCGVCHREGER